jgi:carboxylesterase
MPLLPGAEPYRVQTGPVGALICHGFTATPHSVRPWAEHVAQAGLSVSAPLLPGHGTHWRDLNSTRWPDWYGALEDAYLELADECEQVFAFGLSMGGALALRLAARHGSGISGLVLVNPLVTMPGHAHRLLPVLRHLLPSVSGSNDIAKPGVDKQGYTRTPLHAAHSLIGLTQQVQQDLPSVTQPLLLLRSAQDHVVPPSSAERLLSAIGSTSVRELPLERSFHIATLDYDAETISRESLAFVRRLSRPAEPEDR